jgi:hypothetical protein
VAHPAFHSAQHIGDDAGELVLFGLHPIGMIGVVANRSHIKFCDQSVLAIAILKFGCNQALINDFFGDAQIFEHVQGGRVKS